MAAVLSELEAAVLTKVGLRGNTTVFNSAAGPLIVGLGKRALQRRRRLPGLEALDCSTIARSPTDPGERAEEDTEKSGGTVERQRRFDVSRDGRVLTERLRMGGQATPTCWSSSVNRSRRGSDRLKATARIYSRLRAKKGGRRLVRAREDADVVYEIHSDHAAIAPPELHDVSGFVVHENVST
jgi:hypothetical protein